MIRYNVMCFAESLIKEWAKQTLKGLYSDSWILQSCCRFTMFPVTVHSPNLLTNEIKIDDKDDNVTLNLLFFLI